MKKDNKIKEGEELLLQGKFDEALSYFKKLLEEEKKSQEELINAFKTLGYEL